MVAENNPQVAFSLLEAFAGPAQGQRVDVPSAAVSFKLAGVKRRVDKVASILAHCKRNCARVTGGLVGVPDVLWQARENRLVQEPPHPGMATSAWGPCYVSLIRN